MIMDKQKWYSNRFVKSGAFQLLVGLIIYLWAKHAGPAPDWFLMYIQQSSATVGALNTVAKLNSEPLPLQLVLLFCIPSSLVLSMIYAHRMYFTRSARIAFIENAYAKWRWPRLKMAYICIIFTFCLYVLFFYIFTDGSGSGFTAQRMYTVSVSAAVFFLILNILFSVIFSLLLCAFHIAVLGKNKSKEMSNV